MIKILERMLILVILVNFIGMNILLFQLYQQKKDLLLKIY